MSELRTLQGETLRSEWNAMLDIPSHAAMECDQIVNPAQGQPAGATKDAIQRPHIQDNGAVKSAANATPRL